MRSRIHIRAVGMAALLSATAAHAQVYDLGWQTIDGGGMHFTAGGEFKLSGTIAQPDAGAMSGGGVSLAGGFWPGAASRGGEGCTNQETIHKTKCKVKRGLVKKATIVVRLARPGGSYTAVLDSGQQLEKKAKPNGQVKFVFKGNDAPPCGANAVTVCQARQQFTCGC